MRFLLSEFLNYSVFWTKRNLLLNINGFEIDLSKRRGICCWDVS